MFAFLPGFEPDETPALAARLSPKLRTLAEEGVFFGTSSWKYEGWLGSVYAEATYRTRGRFSGRKFDETCLSEYARTFPTVCGDFTFYRAPTGAEWARQFTALPEGFLVALKVPEEITVATWPTHPRYGARAGRQNAHFLDVGAFDRLFARPLWPFRGRVAALIFEFGAFGRSNFRDGSEFRDLLGGFLSELPDGFRYAVEIRNPEFLGPAHFDLLASRNVAHVFNAWTRMPTLVEQARLPGAFPADFTVVRALLSKGRSYEDAVRAFTPYARIQEPEPGAREGMRRIAERAGALKIRSYFYVNNRLEGHAPGTIEAVADALLL